MVGACGALLLAGLALTWWLADWPRLANLGLASTPMASNTALAVVALGVAALIELRGGAGRVIGVVGLGVSLFAVAQLLPLVSGSSSRLGEMVGPSLASAMSPLTAAGLLAVGLSWLVAGLGRRRPRWSTVGASLALLAMLLGGVVALGYLYGAPLLYGGSSRPMTMSAGLALVLLGCCGLGLARADSAPLSWVRGSSIRARLLRALLPVAPAVGVFHLVLSQERTLDPPLHGALTALLTAMMVLVLVTVAARGVASELARAQLEGDRLSRLYTALNYVNQAIVRTVSRDELFQRVCQVLVDHGGLSMAWVGWIDPDSSRLVPVASWGDDHGYVHDLVVYTDARPEGQGPSGRALRENRLYVCNDLLADPTTAPWRDAARRSGFRASAALPIRVSGVTWGALNVYAAEPGFFRDQECSLLTGAASDISFALDGLAREEARGRAEAEAARERLFSQTMIESLPGVLYLYNEQLQFLRWNKSLEQVTGYSGDELARMNPRNFFAAADHPLLEQRIAEVFARGASTFEADFVAKDGAAVPYYFTGRRLLFDGSPCLVGIGIDVSERRQVERALRESEERFHAFMDATPAIAWITDEAGRHLYMNSAWDVAFGLQRQDFIGKTAADLVAPEAAERIRASDRAVLESERAIVIPEERGEINGQPFYWSSIKFPFRNAAGQRLIGGIAIDITARKDAEMAGRSSEARYRALFEHAPDGIVIADPQSVYLDANASACRMLGYQREELIGLHAVDIVVPDEVQNIARALALINASDNYHREWRFRRKDGSTFAAEVIATLLPDGNLLGMIRDITERKRAEGALRELNETLELKVSGRTAELAAALLRAEAADRLKSAFLATMSHELRTPLNSIIGFTGIVLQGLAGPLTAEQSKQLGMVKTSARHLLDLINDVLDLSKIEAGQLEVRHDPFELAAPIERVIATIRPLAEKKGLELVVELPAQLGHLVSDQRRLEQILINLLNNAVKFTDRGKVTLAVELLEADHSATEAGVTGPAARFRVLDTGIGISAENLATLFQPFRQVDNGLSRQHEGTGLGLAICRRLAALLGGEITARSEWAKGSEFVLTVPLVREVKR